MLYIFTFYCVFTNDLTVIFILNVLKYVLSMVVLNLYAPDHTPVFILNVLKYVLSMVVLNPYKAPDHTPVFVVSSSFMIYFFAI